MNIKKKCNKCKIDKDLTNYYKDIYTSTGFRSTCKLCIKNYEKKRVYNYTTTEKYRICNICNTNKKIDEYYKSKHGRSGYFTYCIECHKNRRNYNRITKVESEEKKMENLMHYINKHETIKKIKINNYRKKVRKYNYANNIQLKIRKSIQKRLLYAVKHNIETSSINKYLNCSIAYFKKWIESQFTDNMSWDNYGIWHYDHVKPCKSYDLTIKEQLCQCFNWKNYQPLMKEDNYIKNCVYNKKLILNHSFKAFKYAHYNPVINSSKEGESSTTR